MEAAKSNAAGIVPDREQAMIERDKDGSRRGRERAGVGGMKMRNGIYAAEVDFNRV